MQQTYTQLNDIYVHDEIDDTMIIDIYEVDDILQLYQIVGNTHTWIISYIHI